MRRAHFEVTYRKGEAIAANLYLDRRPGDQNAGTEQVADWLMEELAPLQAA